MRETFGIRHGDCGHRDTPRHARPNPEGCGLAVAFVRAYKELEAAKDAVRDANARLEQAKLQFEQAKNAI